MYNGIGLQTARGSGTNGYVQKNLSLINSYKDKVKLRTEEEFRKLDAVSHKGPNKEILEHARKRALELKCAEMENAMRDEGYSESDIESRVVSFREMLLARDRNEKLQKPTQKDSSGRIDVRETHEIAEAQQEKNARLKAAFGISDYFEDGSSFDPNRRVKEAERRKQHVEEEKKKKRNWVSTPSPSRSRSRSTERKKKSKKDKKEKKKKRHRERSSSSESHKRKKSKKNKRSRSPTPTPLSRHRKSRSREKRRKGKRKRRYESSDTNSSSSSVSSDFDDRRQKRKSSESSRKSAEKKKKVSKYFDDRYSGSKLERSTESSENSDESTAEFSKYRIKTKKSPVQSRSVEKRSKISGKNDGYKKKVEKSPKIYPENLNKRKYSKDNSKVFDKKNDKYKKNAEKSPKNEYKNIEKSPKILSSKKDRYKCLEKKPKIYEKTLKIYDLNDRARKHLENSPKIYDLNDKSKKHLEKSPKSYPKGIGKGKNIRKIPNIDCNEFYKNAEKISKFDSAVEDECNKKNAEEFPQSYGKIGRSKCIETSTKFFGAKRSLTSCQNIEKSPESHRSDNRSDKKNNLSPKILHDKDVTESMSFKSNEVNYRSQLPITKKLQYANDDDKCFPAMKNSPETSRSNERSPKSNLEKFSSWKFSNFSTAPEIFLLNSASKASVTNNRVENVNKNDTKINNEDQVDFQNFLKTSQSPETKINSQKLETPIACQITSESTLGEKLECPTDNLETRITSQSLVSSSTSPNLEAKIASPKLKNFASPKYLTNENFPENSKCLETIHTENIANKINESQTPSQNSCDKINLSDIPTPSGEGFRKRKFNGDNFKPNDDVLNSHKKIKISFGQRLFKSLTTEAESEIGFEAQTEGQSGAKENPKDFEKSPNSSSSQLCFTDSQKHSLKKKIGVLLKSTLHQSSIAKFYKSKLSETSDGKLKLSETSGGKLKLSETSSSKSKPNDTYECKAKPYETFGCKLNSAEISLDKLSSAESSGNKLGLSPQNVEENPEKLSKDLKPAEERSKKKSQRETVLSSITIENESLDIRPLVPQKSCLGPKDEDQSVSGDERKVEKKFSREGRRFSGEETNFEDDLRSNASRRTERSYRSRSYSRSSRSRTYSRSSMSISPISSHGKSPGRILRSKSPRKYSRSKSPFYGRNSRSPRKFSRSRSPGKFSRSRSPRKFSRSRSPGKFSRSHTKSRTRSYTKSRTRSRSFSRPRSRSRWSIRSGSSRSFSSRSRSRTRSRTKSRSRRSNSRSRASNSPYRRTISRSRTRSPSIPRRKGSPSFLDSRRITRYSSHSSGSSSDNARKRPVPYHRKIPVESSSSSDDSSYRSWSSWSRSRSWSRDRSRTRSR